MKKKSFSVIIAIILSGIIFAPFSVRAEEIETYTQTGDAVSPVISDHTIEKLVFNDNDLFVNPRTKEEIKEYVKAHPSNNSSAVTFDIEPSTKAPYSLGRISEQYIAQMRGAYLRVVKRIFPR